MAGAGKKFQEAGYAFPKPIIDINGKTMIQVVVDNLKPSTPHTFIFICLREHYEKYDLHNILKNATENNFEVVLINDQTRGAASTVLCATNYINNNEELIIANSDQYIEFSIDDFITKAREGNKDGLILTFKSSHPKWSYTRTNADGLVLETAEKKVISDRATVGVYYFRNGSDFVKGAQNMIQKDINYNNEYYVCPVFNEIILNNGKIYIDNIEADQMHSMGTPEDLEKVIAEVKEGNLVLNTND